MARGRFENIDNSDLGRIEEIKKLIVIAMFSDDSLMERLVLKGGNAMDLIYHVGTRASLDVDLSMEGEFTDAESKALAGKVTACLRKTFGPKGYEAFDIEVKEKPERVSPDIKGFWGGYDINFRLIESAKFRFFSGDPEALRHNAIQIGARGKFEIDISKFEYCGAKKSFDLGGYRGFAYTPEMMVCEKLRAICQQMPEYGPIVHRTKPGVARCRDFIDIIGLMETFKLDMVTKENFNLLKLVFIAKRVPLGFLDLIPKYREFHRADFAGQKANVKPGVKLRDFEYYFDTVVGIWEKLKALGNP